MAGQLRTIGIRLRLRKQHETTHVRYWHFTHVPLQTALSGCRYRTNPEHSGKLRSPPQTCRHGGLKLANKFEACNDDLEDTQPIPTPYPLKRWLERQLPHPFGDGYPGRPRARHGLPRTVAFAGQVTWEVLLSSTKLLGGPRSYLPRPKYAADLVVFY